MVHPMNLNLDTPLPPRIPAWIQYPSPRIAVLVTAPHQVSACQLPLIHGLPSRWQGHTHMILPAVASCRGCSQTAHPSCWQGHTHMPNSGGVSPCLHSSSLPYPWHLPRNNSAAYFHSAPVAHGKVAPLHTSAVPVAVAPLSCPSAWPVT